MDKGAFIFEFAEKHSQALVALVVVLVIMVIAMIVRSFWKESLTKKKGKNGPCDAEELDELILAIHAKQKRQS